MSYMSPDSRSLNFLIYNFDKLLFEHDHPVIGTVELFGAKLNICSQEEIDTIEHVKKILQFRSNEYHTIGSLPTYDYSFNTFCELKYRLKRDAKLYIERLNNTLTYKIAPGTVDCMVDNIMR